MYKMDLRGHVAQLILFATLIKFLLRKKQFFMRFFCFLFFSIPVILLQVIFYLNYLCCAIFVASNVIF